MTILRMERNMHWPSLYGVLWRWRDEFDRHTVCPLNWWDGEWWCCSFNLYCSCVIKQRTDRAVPSSSSCHFLFGLLPWVRALLLKRQRDSTRDAHDSFSVRPDADGDIEKWSWVQVEVKCESAIKWIDHKDQCTKHMRIRDRDWNKRQQMLSYSYWSEEFVLKLAPHRYAFRKPDGLSGWS